MFDYITERVIKEGKYIIETGVLDVNLSERHIRGGEATRCKYKGAYSFSASENKAAV